MRMRLRPELHETEIETETDCYETENKKSDLETTVTSRPHISWV